MRSLKFHSIRAQNVLCFGPEGIEIKFSDFGPVVQVQGINLDAPGTEQDPASNGTGKSSVQELISIGLFGRTVKSPTKNKGGKIVNVLADKGEVEVCWDDFRVLRSFKKSKTGAVTAKIELWESPDHVWDDSSLVSHGTSDETQSRIEQVIGLSHHAFCNVVIFDDSNTYSFLEADGPTKRKIVENLLDLEQYRDYHQNCKELLKEVKKQIDHKGREYSSLQDDVDACQRRVDTVKQQEVNWRSTKQTEMKALFDRIKLKQTQLEQTDTGNQLANWQKAQELITSTTEQLTALEGKRDTIQAAIKVARQRLDQERSAKQAISENLQTETLSLRAIETELNNALKLINKLEALEPGTTCPTCLGAIDPKNFGHVIDQGRQTINTCKQSIDAKTSVINGHKDGLSKKNAMVSTIESKIGEAEGKVAVIESEIRDARNKLNTLSKVPKPEGNVAEQVLEAEIVELKRQLKGKKEELEGQSPYKAIAEQAEQEVLNKIAARDAKSVELQEAEKELPYYEFWAEAFGDNGIRKFVIDGIIPALNDRIAYWLQILIDGLIELKFDNMLEETITRNGNPAFYHNMSKGEIRRINLAVSQAFAYVMMLNSSCCPNIIFLDEITGGGIDRAGVPYVYNMIFELAKERKVFVTTHNEILSGLLHGCETLTLRKHKDITVRLS